MGEIMRFRMARAPQRVVVSNENKLELSPTPEADTWLNGPGASESAAGWLGARGLRPPVTRYGAADDAARAMLEHVRWLDEQILARGNEVSWAELEPGFRGHFPAWMGLPRLIAHMGWRSLRADLSLALVALILARGSSAISADVLRLLLVMGLVESAVPPRPDPPLEDGTPVDGAPADGEAPPVNFAARIANLDAPAVRSALRWRTVVLPEKLVNYPFLRRSILARRPGVSDLYIVREEWNRYVLGEIAHIQNVLKGELKSNLLEITDERETTLLTDASMTKSAQQDNQTTDRFELKTSSQLDTSLALHVEGKVDTSGQYGPTKVDTHVGGSFDYSVEESNSRAVTQARESITRAVSSIEESVRTQRTERTLSRTRTKDKHVLDNTGKPDHVVGIYRWVDKIQTVQVFKYPHRLLYEVEIPEPGAFIRWLNKQPKTGALRPVIPFTDTGREDGKPITPDMITGMRPVPGGEIHFEDIAARYNVQGLENPPTNKDAFAARVNDDPDDKITAKENAVNKDPVYKTADVPIPDGYQAIQFRIIVAGLNGVSEEPRNDGTQRPTGWAEVILGTDFPSMAADGNDNDPGQIWRFQGKQNFKQMRTGAFRTPVSGTLPVMLLTDDLARLVVHIHLVCQPTTNTIRTWRQKTHDLLLGAFLALRRQQDEALAREALQTGITITGESAARNAEVVREELKRCSIELLLGARFNGRNAMVKGANGEPDRIDLDGVRKVSEEIQFIEEAFEWENLSFVLYPYLWADSDKWAELERIGSPDANFDRFLRAGSARVVIPARPKYEAATQLFTTCGVPWGGGPAPAPGEELYLSVAEEIRSQQLAPKDGEPGENWEVKLPTTLVYLMPVDTKLPLENENAELPVEAELPDEDEAEIRPVARRRTKTAAKKAAVKEREHA